jgi:transposase
MTIHVNNPPRLAIVMTQREELTDIQKAQIVALSHHYNPTQVGKELNIPRQTVSSFLQRYNQRNSFENLHRSGRPRKTSTTADRWLVRTALDESKLPLKELKSICNIPVSTRTIQRRLAEDNVRKWRAVKQPKLTTDSAKARLKWAQDHQDWTVEQWKTVAWSDESAIKKDSDTRTVWVWRHTGSQGKVEKYLPKNVVGKRRDGDISQMVWGCFVDNKLGPLVFIDENINAGVYMAVLEQNFLEYVEELTAEGLQGIVFQQDNARPHIAKVTQRWLENAGKEHGFTVMDWPPYSPDLNPIENLWAILKMELHRRYPDTKYLRGSPATVKSVLKKRLHEVWWDIGEGMLNQLIESMLERVQAVLEAEGWYTRF